MIRQKLFEIIVNTEGHGYVTRIRKQRFRLFEGLVKKINKTDEVRILDVGGTLSYWKQVYDTEENPLNLKITLLNINGRNGDESFFEFRHGDARKLHDIKDNAYDICFSNSMIEHVGDFTQQFLAVAEMTRVAKHLYLQTPNFFFPLEPHYQLFFVHWLPFPLKVRILSIFDKTKNPYDTYLTNPVNLLTKKELRYLFDADKYNLYSEKKFFFTKSFVIISK